ncbi:hypothetical protein [Methylocystis echinoides]|uniref:hypothetical protein n=1 Tax=Methylocystis echinoides TaxID=29468 RepID=UPI003421C4B1
MTLIELPRRRGAPRAFVEPPAGLERRVNRALDALGDLPEGLDLPGLEDLAGALIAIADELQGDVDIEPDEDCAEDEALPLFAFAARAGPP